MSFTLAEGLAAKAGRLAWVQAMGSGTDAIRPPAGRRVILTSAAGLNPVPVAEAAMTMLLAHARNLPAVVRNQGAHRWEPTPSRLLKGATLAILGTGHIARALARRAAAFEMRVVGFSNAPRELPDFDRCTRVTRLRPLPPSWTIWCC